MRRTVVVAMLAASLVVVGLSMLVVLPAPTYDPWSWLGWGDQVASGRLETRSGPSFKPLPVAVATLVAPLGAAAPWLWVLVARIGAAAAVVLACQVGRRLAGGSWVAGVLAAVGVVLCGNYVELAATGMSEGLLLALALAGAQAWSSGRPRWALACGLGAALVRVETWPFLLAAGVVLWRRRPQDRALLVAAAVLVPLTWMGPELVGSGQVLRSATRARIPNPGQPALSDTPALASLRAALMLPLWPVWAGLAVPAWRAWRHRDGDRSLLIVAALGMAWVGLVAVMARVGFTGEPRYALPGAALVAVSGAAGLVVSAQRLTSGRLSASGALTGLAVLVMVGAGLARMDGVVDVQAEQRYQWQLQSDLEAVVATLGGTDAVVACGRPYVGPLRGPLLAHHLGLARDRVEPDAAPTAPGVVFRSALHAGEAAAPAVPPGFLLVAEKGPWRVFADCAAPGVLQETSSTDRGSSAEVP